MKKQMYLIITLLMLASCGGHQERVEETIIGEESKPEARITIYFPDGSDSVIDVLETNHYSESMRTYYTDMEGYKHSTTLPVIVDSY